MSTKQLNWQKVKGGEYFARVGSLWLSEEDIDCYSKNSWEQYELYINKERAGKWYISAEAHSDQDFEQVFFPTLKEAQEALQDLAENILHCYQEQMAEDDEASRQAETEVFQETGKISQDYIDICSELMKESVEQSVESLKSFLEVEPNDNPPPVNPEIDTPDFDEPDFDHEPSEIDHPDYLEVYPDYMGVDSEIDSNEYLSEPMSDKDWHIVRNTWFEADNPEATIIESHYDRELDVLIVFGVSFGDLKDTYCIWKYINYRTDVIFVGRKEALYQRYKKYCDELLIDVDTGFVIPAQTNLHLREYLERLEPDGRMILKTQLNLFGEG